MRHALITAHLLNQARAAAIAQAQADERLEHEALAMPATSPPEPAGWPGSSPWPAASAAWRTDHLTASTNRGMHTRF